MTTLPKLTAGTKPSELWHSHSALYALMIVIPIVDWIGASPSGLPMSFFGLGLIPVLTGTDQSLRDFAPLLHGGSPGCL